MCGGREMFCCNVSGHSINKLFLIPRNYGRIMESFLSLTLVVCYFHSRFGFAVFNFRATPDVTAGNKDARHFHTIPRFD